MPGERMLMPRSKSMHWQLLGIYAGKILENDLVERLAKDKRIGLKISDLRKLIKQGDATVGAAHHQVDHFLKRVKSWSSRYPEAKNYSPSSIL